MFLIFLLQNKIYRFFFKNFDQGLEKQRKKCYNLNVCTTALQDTQENQDYANWNGAPPLPREPGKGEDL